MNDNQMIITTRYFSRLERKEEIGNFGILMASAIQTVLQVEGISKVKNKSPKSPEYTVPHTLKYSKFCLKLLLKFNKSVVDTIFVNEPDLK